MLVSRCSSFIKHETFVQIVNVNNCHWVGLAKMNPNEYVIDLFDSNRQSYVYEDLGKQVLSFLPDDVTEVIFTSHNVQPGSKSQCEISKRYF